MSCCTRDIYEEAIQTVTTVRDFTQVFDAYAQFEELALSKKMEELAEMEKTSSQDEVEVELRMARWAVCKLQHGENIVTILNCDYCYLIIWRYG